MRPSRVCTPGPHRGVSLSVSIKVGWLAFTWKVQYGPGWQMSSAVWRELCRASAITIVPTASERIA